MSFLVASSHFLGLLSACFLAFVFFAGTATGCGGGPEACGGVLALQGRESGRCVQGGHVYKVGVLSGWRSVEAVSDMSF